MTNLQESISVSASLVDPDASAADHDRPVVAIVGAVRAGSTLLRLLVDHHPEISLIGEFEESVVLLPDSGELDVDEYCRRLEDFRAFRSSGVALPTDVKDYRQAVQEILRERLSGSSARTVGFCVHTKPDRLPELWPEARYVHLVRDPRDVARSCIGMGWVGTVYHGTHYWLESERRIEAMRRRVPEDRVLTVKYEDLVRSPEAELRRVCEFLGHDYDPAMLGIEGSTSYSRPDPRLAEQWKTKLTPREIELIELRCGEMMTARGYERQAPTAKPPGVVERLSLQVRHRYGRLKFRTNRYGLWLTLGWAVAKRLPRDHWLHQRLRLRIDDIDTANLK